MIWIVVWVGCTVIFCFKLGSLFASNIFCHKSSNVSFATDMGHSPFTFTIIIFVKRVIGHILSTPIFKTLILKESKNFCSVCCHKMGVILCSTASFFTTGSWLWFIVSHVVCTRRLRGLGGHRNNAAKVNLAVDCPSPYEYLKLIYQAFWLVTIWVLGYIYVRGVSLAMTRT